ncbi:transcriptional regulator ATRX [Culex quinquefasciatus]|uniref:Transcriptional regulator ATRX n=1 Tax=Culex quinquefasciatus TaxID=7176 RepID=B0WSS1_CULQU|nr:transcriptional regulator ATRX [Culex quinquefasciatus]|eukprot:XP_001853354.1 transcriptional regulator ATRX [Culex quinquefasciatus]
MRTKKTTRKGKTSTSSSEGDDQQQVSSTSKDVTPPNGTEEPVEAENGTTDNNGKDSPTSDKGSSVAQDEEPIVEVKKEETAAAKVLRLVSIEKLMRPSLLATNEEKPIPKIKIGARIAAERANKRGKDASVIEISDTEEDDEQPLAKKSRNESVQNISSDEESEDDVPIKRRVSRAAKKPSKIVIKDEEDEEEEENEAPVVKKKLSGPNKSKSKSAKLPEGCKPLRVKVSRLPENLEPIKRRYKLTAILDVENRVITKLAVTAASAIPSKPKEAEASAKSRSSDSKKTKSGGGPTVALSSGSDSDEPIAKIATKKDNIPKNKTTTMAGRSKRTQVVASDDDDDDDFEVEKPAKAAPTGRRGRGRPAKEAAAESEEDGKNKSDSDDDFEKEKTPPKKKRSRIKRNSSTSDEDDDDDGGKNEDDSPTKGRKKIRKILKKSKLEQTTKEAEQEERERKQRIAERQKLYNQVYDEKPEEVKELKQLVLDFDEETKEPLLEVDKTLVKKLKPHQANGIKFMFDACFESLERARNSKGSGCILAHCMGLGKTLQVVTLCHTLLSNSESTGVERILVICPLSTVLNWVNEFRIWMKHVKKGTEVEVYEISKYKNNIVRANQLMEWHNEGGVMVLGYDMYRNLSNQTTGRIKKKVRESLSTSLIDPGPDLIVCDEGHLLKNEKTSLSKAVNRITTLRRIVLTGTPIQNNMKEYYCMVQFVKPKLLGTYNEYMNRFVNPITNGQYTDSTPYDIQLMRKRAHVLHKLLDGCVQRRDYAVLAPFLPPKLEFVVSIKLTPLQVTLYKYYMETQARKQSDETKRASVLFADFQNLQRIWTHPRVLRYNSDRYEYMQQKKRDMESDEESMGSMKDFLDDEDSEAETTPDESESESESDDSDDSRKKSKKNKGKKESKKEEKASSDKGGAAPSRRTRNNPDAGDDDVQEVEQKNENPTELWMFMCPEEELNNLEHSGKLQVLFEILKECEVIGDKLLFLISTRAGGLGINLVAANRVIIFDVSWNPSHDIQSIFRVYRFGQVKPCYIYRFLAMGTMEEKIYERQVTKQAISKRVIDEQQIDRHYKENDLQELYRYDMIDPEEARPMPNLPKDRLFAELLKKFETLLYKYHEHDSLLENKEEETLNEEERKAAWEEFEQEKNRPPVTNYGGAVYGMNMGMNMNMGMRGNGPVTSSNIFGFRNDVLLKLLNMKARQDNPTFNDSRVATLIPFLMQELCRQMKDGELSMYKSLLELYYQLEAPSYAAAGMGYNNPMMMQQQQPQQMGRPMMMGGAQATPAYNMTQLQYMREQEQLRYAQMGQPGGSGTNRGVILNEAQKRFMNDPVEIVELD